MNEEDNNIIYNTNNDKHFVICIKDGKTTIVKDGLINIGNVKKSDHSNIVSSDSEEKAIAIEKNVSDCNHDIVTILELVDRITKYWWFVTLHIICCFGCLAHVQSLTYIQMLNLY